ncbi:MAG: gamma-glutamyltransferase, partial [Chloroflexota bacterium]
LPNVPRDAYWAWGLGDSLIVVIPSLDIVVARAGSGWRAGWNPNYAVLQPFLDPIVSSVR